MAWEYYDRKLKELQKEYDKEKKRTQNRLQEKFNLLNFDEINTLYSIADYRLTKKVDTYIDEWREKGYLKGYFGNQANNIYRRKRVKNSEILELFIYFALTEEEDDLSPKEQEIFFDVASYYYMEGQRQAGRKKPSPLSEVAFLSLLALPTVAGYTWKEYKGSTTLRNTYEIYRLSVQDIQMGKKPDAFSDLFEGMLLKQQNRKLKIKDGRTSGEVDLMMVGINNRALVDGMIEVDPNAKAEFIAVMDKRTTDMCRSLDGQIFNVNDWNTFTRYSDYDKGERQFKCFGFVLGLNLPPIDNHFHYCRSTIEYVDSIENGNEKWYNKLGNGNSSGYGGSGKGIFIEKISEKELNSKLEQFEDEIRNMKIEYGIVIDKDYNVYAYIGDSSNLSITDRNLEDVILTHNHPEIASFGEDDFSMLKANPTIKELRAVDAEFNYKLKLLKPLDITYNEVYKDGLQLAKDTDEEIQHSVMQILKERGYIQYDRTRKK